MTRWRLWKDQAIVWFFALLIDAAIALIRIIRRRKSPGAGGSC